MIFGINLKRIFDAIAGKASKPASSTTGNLAAFDGAGNLADAGVAPTAFDAAGSASTVNASLVAHESDHANPHAVTSSQVGLGLVTNDAQLKIASNLADLNNAATARGNLGLGTIATHGATDYLPTTGGTVTGNVQVDGSFTLFAASGESFTLIEKTDEANTAVSALYLLPATNLRRIFLGDSTHAVYSLNLAHCSTIENFPSVISPAGNFIIELAWGSQLYLRHNPAYTSPSFIWPSETSDDHTTYGYFHFKSNMNNVGAGGKAYVLDTSVTRTGGNLLSVRNNGTERLGVDYAGNVILNGGIIASAGGICFPATGGVVAIDSGGLYYRDGGLLADGAGLWYIDNGLLADSSSIYDSSGNEVITGGSIQYPDGSGSALATAGGLLLKWFATGSYPATPVAGTMIWDSTALALKVYNGTAWKTATLT